MKPDITVSWETTSQEWKCMASRGRTWYARHTRRRTLRLYCGGFCSGTYTGTCPIYYCYNVSRLRIISLTMNQLELPHDFPHQAPKGYHYEVDQFRRNIHRICIINDGTFSYTVDAPKCVWGFVKTTGRKEALRRLIMPPSTSIR